MKPQQDKFAKDKLLNEIFQEIADENAETGETRYQEEKSIDHGKKLARKRLIQKIRQRVIIVLLIALILFVLFNPNDDTSDLDIIDTKENMYSIPMANQIPTEAEELNKEVLPREEPMIKISEKVMMIDVPTPNAKTLAVEKPTENTNILTGEEPKTTREKAKNLLMEQMQN